MNCLPKRAASDSSLVQVTEGEKSHPFVTLSVPLA